MAEIEKDTATLEIEKAKRIKTETKRLKSIFKDIDEAQKLLADKLIQRAAYMCVMLEDMELDILARGWTEPFLQSKDLKPYDRVRPIAQAYQQLNKNYQNIIRQLTVMLPESQKKTVDDGFNSFCMERSK